MTEVSEVLQRARRICLDSFGVIHPPVIVVISRLLLDGIEFIPTGSRVIGGFSDDSDWDIVAQVEKDDCYPDDFADLLGDSESRSLPYGVHYSAQYLTSVRVPGGVNVIFDDRPNAIQKWEAATQAAIQAKAHTREERVKIFVEHGA